MSSEHEEQMMNENERTPGAHDVQHVPSRGELDGQIAQQAATIQRLVDRLSGPLDSQRTFSLVEFSDTMGLEADLAAARERRGQLIYDRMFATMNKPH
jgi:hypothetical protein